MFSKVNYKFRIKNPETGEMVDNGDCQRSKLGFSSHWVTGLIALGPCGGGGDSADDTSDFPKVLIIQTIFYKSADYTNDLLQKCWLYNCWS